MWFEGDIRTPDGVRLHYYETGGEKPPLVCFHGFGEYGLSMARLVKRWADQYRIILPDHRAHGKSEGPASTYSLEERTRDMEALLDGLNLENPILMGHSLGASISANIASRQLERIRRTILIDPGWNTAQIEEDEAERQRSYDYWFKVVSSWMKRPSERLRMVVKRSFPLWAEEDYDRWMEGKAMMNPEVMLPGLLEPLRPWTEIAAEIVSPTMLLTGDTGAGAMITPEVSEMIHELNPSIQIENFPGAGHYIHLDAFDEVGETIETFFGSLT